MDLTSNGSDKIESSVIYLRDIFAETLNKNNVTHAVNGVLFRHFIRESPPLAVTRLVPAVLILLCGPAWQ